MLVNGEEIGLDRSILSYPPEALDRLAVLKPEAAARYGHAPGKRVVNLVLKKSFASMDADAALSWATAGGQSGGSLSVRRVAIDGPTRWNVQARGERSSALYRNDRNVPPRAGPFDAVGYIAAPDGGEIDSALSQVAGETVTVAALPQGASSAPTLADFAGNANRLNAVDPGAFETLLPSRRNMSFNAGVTRPIGAFSASLSINANDNASNGLRGLPMTSAIVPTGNAWSPFADDIVLTRPFAGLRALRNDNGSQSLGASATLTGNIDGWQSSLSANYARNWADSLLETGVDTGGFQRLIDEGDPALNPYGTLDSGLLLANRNRSRGENFGARLNVIKKLADMPAGPLTSSYAIDMRHSRSIARRSAGLNEPVLIDERSRGQMNGQVSVTVPISRKEIAELGPLGDLSIELSLSGQTQTDVGLQQRYGGGVTWSPVSVLQLRGSIDYAETAPSIDQLDGPVTTTVNRVFDFLRQETVDVVWITGGNPDLARGNRRGLSLTARILPFDTQMLSLNLGYRQQVATGGAASFPELTPSIEAAFPDRVTRDAEGRLIAIDARAINIVRDVDAEMTSGMALRWPTPDVARAGGLAASAGAIQWSLSINHRWRLQSELLTGVGLPVIDRLSGDGGQSRHSLSLQLTGGKQGIGATLNGNWSSPTRVRRATATAPDTDFRIEPSPILNLSLFVEPEHLFADADKLPWASKLRLSVDVQNLFNGYRRVSLDDGSVPPGFTRDEIDPLGRTVRLSVRKRF